MAVCGLEFRISVCFIIHRAWDVEEEEKFWRFMVVGRCVVGLYGFRALAFRDVSWMILTLDPKP